MSPGPVPMISDSQRLRTGLTQGAPAEDTASRRARFSGVAELFLTWRYARFAIFSFALLLTSSYLVLGGTGDDDFHAVAVRDHPALSGVQRAPWDLFAFATPSTNHALMEEGVFPWWTDPDLVIDFYRPLSSLTLWVDYTLWPYNSALMHLHSMLWFALLLGAVAWVYRELSLSPKHAALALLLFAIDDARSMPVAWLAQRNALVALVPAFLTLVAHHRYRVRGSAWYGALACLCLAVGFQGGESALAVCGYLFAYALVLDRGSLWTRARSLLPYLLVVVLWRAFYVYLGKGALYSGIYVDPGRDPLEFLRLLSVRLPVLLLGQFALPFSDLWEAYPLMASWLRPTVLVFAAVVLGGLYWLLRPLLREHPLLRFWLLGSVLATLPMCGVHPEDRMLTATALGGAQLIATLLFALLDATYPKATRTTTAAGFALVGIHLVFAPLTLPLRSFDIYAMERLMAHSDKSIPSGDEAKQASVVLVNPPIDVFGIYFPVYRAARHLPLPKHFRWLATGECDLELTRVDERALRVTPRLGFLATASQLMFRRAQRSFAPDEPVELDGVRFEVTALTDDGRPAEVLVQFDRPLESPSLTWLQWGKHEYVPFKPPKVGASVVLPKVDLAALFEKPS